MHLPTTSTSAHNDNIYNEGARRGLGGNARAVGVRGPQVDPHSPVVFQETKNYLALYCWPSRMWL